MTNEYILEVNDLNVFGVFNQPLLKQVSFSVKANRLVTIIGSPDSGKNILLSAINRLNELSPSIKTTGEILLGGASIFQMPLDTLRRRVGMVFSKPNVFFHWSIYDNVIAGYKLNAIRLSKSEADVLVETNLRQLDLWNELKDDLFRKPDFLSVGQQQCLCIARTMALRPEVLLMDEPTILLNTIYTEKIINLLKQLMGNTTVLVSTHYPTRATLVSDYTMYLENGEIVEYDTTSKLFLMPEDRRTEKYINHQI
ncbi:MAG: ATP-binding cassette domain-containing protein [Candidatus Symbiothrix sp.]|jgi:phosphate transport system ATP-binding protein|nr:ATP-binding cassette domain-containing protein [Candidatus Symbiothrix sp.]